MTRFPFSARRQALLGTVLAAASLSAAYAADKTDAAPPAAQDAAGTRGDAPAMPAPNPAAEKALGQRFQAIYAAFEGKSALPDSKSFTDDFNQQVTAEQMKQVFQQVHQLAGSSCRIVGQVPSPISYAGSYLLQCDKAFVPMDISVEEKAPYRIQSLLIRPGFVKK